MWLMYPVQPAHVRSARRGVAALLSASAVWYLTVAVVVAVWPDAVLEKVRNKFMDVPETPKNWLPFLLLLGGFTLSGSLRALGYRLGRDITGAVAVPEAHTVATLGAGLWLAACGSIYVGFTGLLALVAAAGTAVELRFLRYPVTLFGLVVSPRAVRRVNWYFYARSGWLMLVVLSSLIILVAHAVTDIPRTPGGPYEESILRVTGVLHVAFQAVVTVALVTLPAVTAGYWLVLAGVYQHVGRLLDPNGPVAQPEPPPRPGFDQLKSVLQPQNW